MTHNYIIDKGTQKESELGKQKFTPNFRVLLKFCNNMWGVFLLLAGILQYEQLLHEIHSQELIFDVIVLRVSSINDCYRRLIRIYNDDPGNIRVLLNLQPEDSQSVISRLVSCLIYLFSNFTFLHKNSIINI